MLAQRTLYSERCFLSTYREQSIVLSPGKMAVAKQEETLPLRASSKSFCNSVQSAEGSNNCTSLRGCAAYSRWGQCSPHPLFQLMLTGPHCRHHDLAPGFLLACVHRTGPCAREITGPVVFSDTEGLQGDYLGFLTLLWDNFKACSAQGPSGPQWDGDPLLHGGSCSLTYPIVSPFPSCLTSPHPCRLFLGSPSKKTLCPQTYA